MLRSSKPVPPAQSATTALVHAATPRIAPRVGAIASPGMRKLFADDLAHHFGRQRPVIFCKRGAQRLVDEGLVGAPGRVCFDTESFDDILIDPDRDACLDRGGDSRASLAATWAKAAGGWTTSGQRQCA